MWRRRVSSAGTHRQHTVPDSSTETPLRHGARTIGFQPSPLVLPGCGTDFEMLFWAWRNCMIIRAFSSRADALLCVFMYCLYCTMPRRHLRQAALVVQKTILFRTPFFKIIAHQKPIFFSLPELITQKNIYIPRRYLNCSDKLLLRPRTKQIKTCMFVCRCIPRIGLREALGRKGGRNRADGRLDFMSLRPACESGSSAARRLRRRSVAAVMYDRAAADTGAAVDDGPVNLALRR